ncbi:phage tail protein [Streptomyces sp. NPDC006654]|uniref:phage tail protein n=1 Tax=Streptomyces sp. NPDC006654 TaxID=3156897 RepID=UPI0033D69ED1
MSDYMPPVVLEFEGRTAGVERAIEKVKADVRRFTTDMGRMQATIKVDAKLRDGTLAEIRRRINESPAAKLKVDLQLGAGQRDQLRAQLEGRPVTANVRPVMDQAALRRVQTVLRELGRRIDVQIRPDLDTAAQRRAQRRLDRMSQDRTVVIRTRVIGDSNRVPSPGGRDGGGSGGAMGALLTLAPALTPIAAQAAVVAAQVGAAAVAVGAFGAALKPQLAALSSAADAQKAYNDAVTKYGPASSQAAKAQEELSQTLAGMPSATRQAAGAFLNLKSDFTAWSNSLSRFTMVPVTQGISVLDALLPRLSPLVKDTAGQFTRLTTLLAGGINGGAFDGLMAKFTTFASGALRSAVDDVVHFSRVLSEGSANGAFAQFMTYAKTNGPLVKDTLKSLAAAVQNIIKGASEAGPGMLTLVNALAKLVAALPPSVIASLLQVSAAIKAIGLARSGIDAVSGPIGTLRTRLMALLATSRAAGGGLTGLRAAFNSLSTGAKIGVAVGGITALIAVMHELSDNKAPVAVDQLSASLNTLASTGKVTGALKTNFKEMSESIAMLTKGASDNKIVQLTSDFGTFVGISTGPGVSDARKNLDAWDKSMAQLVQSGHPKEAAAQYDILKRAWLAGGGDLKRLGKFTDDYNSALADQKFQAKLAADAMGVFGEQAQRVQQKLDAQKQAAQGLQQAILDLNDANRAALDAESAYQQAIDDATAAINGHRNALSYSNGELNLGSQKAREAYGALSQLAASAEAAATSTLQQTNSQEKANKVLIDAHAQLVRVGRQMGLSAAEANRLADRLDNINDPKIRVTLYTQQAMSDLAAAKRRVDAFPKSTRTKANFAYQQALADLQFWQRQVDRIHGKTVQVRINGVMTGVNAAQYYSQGPHKARGGLIEGPGTATSDSVPAMLSDGEYVVNAAATKRNRRLLEAINSDRVQHFARGGLTSAEKDARGQLSGSFGISAFGRMAGYQHTGFERGLALPSDINALVSSLNQFRAEIKAAFRGRAESSLLRQLDKAGKSLISYDKQLTKVNASLASAKSKLDDLKNSAAQLKASVASSIMQNVSVVTQAPQAGFALTSQDVVNSMSAQLSQTLTFSNQLQTLKKRGLSADLLEQLASAGVDQGGATAAALAGASDSQLKALNNMQAQLKKSANAAGSAVSDAMYGAGIRAADGLVKGLEKKQKSIEAAMLRIAKSMEKAIKAALKIKSPSQVMADVGDYTALGLAHGIRRSSKHAVIAARGMAMSVAHGATLAGSPTWSGVPRGGVVGGAPVTNIHIHIEPKGHVLTTNRELREIVEQEMVRLGARNSMTYQPYKR